MRSKWCVVRSMVTGVALEVGAINALRINVDNTLMAIFTMHIKALARFLRRKKNEEKKTHPFRMLCCRRIQGALHGMRFRECAMN